MKLPTFVIIVACLWTPLIGVSCGEEVARPAPVSESGWTYFAIDTSRSKWGDWDPPEWLRYFGLDAADADGDGDLDLVSGRYFYENPGGTMAADWRRVDLGLNVDACLFVDVDGDTQTDVIAQAYPAVYWLEATDAGCSSWSATRIGELPPTDHTNGQGYRVVDLDGDSIPEIILQAGGGLYAASIPQQPATLWTWRKLASLRSDEGIGIGDIDGDGDLDLAVGDVAAGGEQEHPTKLLWLENPGSLSDEWPIHQVGSTVHAIDRVEVADFDRDGQADIAVSIERYPGEEPDASLYVFLRKAGSDAASWRRLEIVRQYSMNNLSVGDIDQDGDPDLVTSEHTGPNLRLQIWENQMPEGGSFRRHPVGQQAEMHLGARLFDLDNDGDLDIVGHAWDRHELLHLWRNDQAASK